jgi:hypothetical protein
VQVLVWLQGCNSNSRATHKKVEAGGHAVWARKWHMRMSSRVLWDGDVWSVGSGRSLVMTKMDEGESVYIRA